MKLKIISWAIIIIFGFYWLTTFFFNLPDNYLKAKLGSTNDLFTLTMFQRWSFFAPPPNYNDRMYFVYKKSQDSATHTVEILKKITDEKSAKAPFNAKEDILDYLISNPLCTFTEQKINIENYNQYKQTTHSKEQGRADNIYNDNLEESEQLAQLFKYAQIIKSEKNELRGFDSVSIVITHLYIPKFADRYKNDPLVEEIFYQSKFHVLK